MQAFAARRADISEGLLQKERAHVAELAATVAQLRLMLDEAATAGEAAREELRTERQNSRRAAQAAAQAAESAAAEAQALQVRCMTTHHTSQYALVPSSAGHIIVGHILQDSCRQFL